MQAEARIAQLQAEKIIVQAETSAVQAETRVVQVQTQAAIDKISVLSDLNSLTNSLEKAQSRLNCLTPRAILEYVEVWVMPIETKKLSREERWQTFLAETEAGRAIRDRILYENKQWKESSLANRIAGLYQHMSDSLYDHMHVLHTIKQPHDIQQKVILEKLGLTAQAFNAASCIAIALELKIGSAYHSDKNDDF